MNAQKPQARTTNMPHIYAKIITVSIVLLGLTSTVWAISSFQLSDQFGKRHSKASIFKDKPIILIGGAQKSTSKAMPPWFKALKKDVGGRATIYGVLDLGKLPFFVPTSLVKKRLKSNHPKDRILCDLDGDTYKKLGFTRDAELEIQVYDARGTLLKTISGRLNNARKQAVLSSIP